MDAIAIVTVDVEGEKALKIKNLT